MAKDATTRYRQLAFVRPARGGVSGGAIFTGVVVAFGSMFLLSAVVAGVLATIGFDAADAGDSPIEAGLGAGAALVLAQFFSYLWGGYTAGRMGRGAGLANGLLVPLIALLLAVVVAAVAAGLGTSANLNLPFQAYRLPVEDDVLVQWSVGIGIATLAAMFLGGAVGGMLGTRWHTKLEAAAVAGASTPPEDATEVAGRGPKAENL
ncbi:MAG TPA: hypothetical protein VNP73_05940 [Actinomycetota bacterium]|nr:hypothetical protein [Actinomycetota bacterium]